VNVLSRVRCQLCSVTPIAQPNLLAAAARADCDEATLVELGRISEEARDFSQSLPIFVRHLSYPRTTIASIGDAKWKSLEGRAASSLAPMIGSVSLLMEEHAESRPLLISAAPDIWLWLGRWIGAALSHLFDTPHSSGGFDLMQTFSGMLGFIVWTELIVPDTVDVVVTFFCMGARSGKLRDEVRDIMKTVRLPPRGDRGFGYEDEGTYVCISHLLESRAGWNEDLVSDRVHTLSEEIITHTFVHLDLVLSLQDTDKRSWKQTTKSAETLLLLVLRVIDCSGSSLSEFTHVPILTHVLGLCDRIVRRNSNLVSEENLVRMACYILRCVFSAQSSTLSLAALLSHALDKHMFPFLCRAASSDLWTDRNSDKAYNLATDINFLLDNIIFEHMCLLEVYGHLRQYAAVGSDIETKAQELVGRWSSEFDAVSAQLADQRRIACSHSQVSSVLALKALALTELVSAQGFQSRSLLSRLSEQQILQSRMPTRCMARRQTPLHLQAGDDEASQWHLTEHRGRARFCRARCRQGTLPQQGCLEKRTWPARPGTW
jgi:hypothetical protein